MMGIRDYKKYSRPVAHMCNLLDAAACLTGVPLLALVAVRANNGEINPKSWSGHSVAARKSIIDRSLGHKFSHSDFKAIGRALGDLKGLGDRRAWAHVRDKYGDLLYGHLIGGCSDPLYGALDDFGADDPARVHYSGWAYLRNQQVRSAVLVRASGKCEYCGEEGFPKTGGGRYLETHHVIALANEGEDRLSNVIALCPNDHRRAHFSKEWKSIEQQMQDKLAALNGVPEHGTPSGAE